MRVCVASERSHAARRRDKADAVASAIRNIDRSRYINCDAPRIVERGYCGGAVRESGQTAAGKRRDDARARHGAKSVVALIGDNYAIICVDANTIRPMKRCCRPRAVRVSCRRSGKGRYHAE
jgi:hypothetical protein